MITMNQITKTFAVALVCGLVVLITAILTKTPRGSKPVQLPELNQDNTEAILQLTNQTFLVLGQSVVVKVSDAHWDVITNAYPEHLITKDLVFWKRIAPVK
ncbi:MAG: hypothetical protein O2960_25580 [Verrucomicrobia bacterium]|jgi:hypothetical protein|nr:hypothetical protein [Verrucomicrobiota bacterium]